MTLLFFFGIVLLCILYIQLDWLLCHVIAPHTTFGLRGRRCIIVHWINVTTLIRSEAILLFMLECCVGGYLNIVSDNWHILYPGDICINIAAAYTNALNIRYGKENAVVPLWCPDIGGVMWRYWGVMWQHWGRDVVIWESHIWTEKRYI